MVDPIVGVTAGSVVAAAAAAREVKPLQEGGVHEAAAIAGGSFQRCVVDAYYLDQGSAAGLPVVVPTRRVPRGAHHQAADATAAAGPIHHEDEASNLKLLVNHHRKPKGRWSQ